MGKVCGEEMETAGKRIEPNLRLLIHSYLSMKRTQKEITSQSD